MTANLSASSPHDYPRLDDSPETSAAMIREHAPKTAAVIGAEALDDAAQYFDLVADTLRDLARTLDTDGGER